MKKLLIICISVLALTVLIILSNGCGKPNAASYPPPVAPEPEAELLLQFGLIGEPLDLIYRDNIFYILEKNRTISSFYWDGFNLGLYDRYHLNTNSDPKLFNFIPATQIYIVAFQNGIKSYYADREEGAEFWNFGSSGTKAIASIDRIMPVVSQWDNRVDTVKVSQLVYSDADDGLNQRIFFPDSIMLADSSAWLTTTDRGIFTGAWIGETQIPTFLCYPFPDHPDMILGSFGESGLKLIQLDNSPPEVIYALSLVGGNYERIAVDTTNRRLAAAGEWQVCLVSTNNYRLQILSEVASNGFDNIVDVALQNNKLAILDRLDGVQFFDIADPTEPLEMERYKIKTGVRITFDNIGNLICISESNGFSILKPSF